MSGDGVAREPTEEDLRELRSISADATEMEESEKDSGRPDQPPVQASDVPGLKVLQSLMKATLFTDYFAYHANLRYLDRTSQERVARLIAAHPLFYRICRMADLMARGGMLAIITLTLTAVAWGFVWKTFFADYFNA
ncbi:hypothetical protein [Curtobacterium sp. VKM Ac-2852]|uniref:hypothetical protein n=1 Tax=Curtobacterium sp. VKM Ac-2852 TaxID=2739024 RepID=UPI0015679719|nr:hypothetical protein [Curtobacterium sp. VKM Ac-2852]NQX22678.1 hypothetical protein [Curtobacterium sp. VKM Ac-2852]